MRERAERRRAQEVELNARRAAVLLGSPVAPGSRVRNLRSGKVGVVVRVHWQWEMNGGTGPVDKIPTHYAVRIPGRPVLTWLVEDVERVP